MNYIDESSTTPMSKVLMIAPAPSRVSEDSFANILLEIKESKPEEFVIFEEWEGSGTNEIQSLVKEHVGSVRTIRLEKLQTEGYSSKTELDGIPWRNLQLIVSESLDSECTYIIGPGSRMNAHLLWLACLVTESNPLHIYGKSVHVDSTHPDLMFSNTTTTSGSLATMIDAIANALSKNHQNSDLFVHHHFSSNDAASTAEGLSASLSPAIAEGMVDVIKEGKKENITFYQLKQKGWMKALDSWRNHSIENLDDGFSKRLVISFGRLPDIQGLSSSNPGVFNMPSYLRKLMPFDSFLAIVQRHDNLIEGSHVLPLSEGDSLIDSPSLVESASLANEVLNRRSDEEDLPRARHLLVVNPDTSEEFAITLLKELLHSLYDFEKENGIHAWRFDMTSPLMEISQLISMFSFATASELAYVMRSSSGVGATGGEIKKSKFSSHAHRLLLPGRATSEIMKKAKKGGSDFNNILKAFLHLEPSKANDSHLPPRARKNSESSNIGITIKEIQNTLKQNKNVSRVVTKKLLPLELVCCYSNHSNSKSDVRQYLLTNKGRFLAELIKDSD